MSYDFDEQALLASINLIGRSGAKQFEFGWLDDDVPIEDARWWAKARWGGEILTEEDHPGPVEAADALARRVMAGGMCVHCKQRISLGEEQPDVCVWRRVRDDSGTDKWERGCLAEFPEADTRPTTHKLAAALQQRGAPVEMVHKALAGYYDDFKSPLAMPEFQLIQDAMAAGLHDIAEMVKEGKFDATKEESEAWAKGPEGQAVFAELLAGGKHAKAKNPKEKPKHRGRYTPPKGKG